MAHLFDYVNKFLENDILEMLNHPVVLLEADRVYYKLDYEIINVPVMVKP